MSTIDSLETWAQEHGYSLRQAWQRCPRGDLMLRWAGPRVERRELVLAGCECARLSLHLVPDEPAARTAIETAEAWARGDEGVTLDDMCRAAAAAYAAAYVYYAADAFYAYYAVLAAAHAYYAYYSALAAYYASYAAVAAYYAANYAAAASDDPEQVQRECATICRRRWPTLPEDAHSMTTTEETRNAECVERERMP